MGVSFTRKAIVIATCSAIGLAACSSDDSKTAATTAGAAGTTASTTAGAGSATTTAGGTATTAGAAVNSAPFKVMVIGDFTSTIGFSVPEIAPATKAVLKSLPSATVLTCDSKSDANAATACERKAVDEKVSAVIAGFSRLAQDQSILDKAGIPTLGYVDEKVSTSFALTSSQGAYTGMGIALANAGCKKIGVLMLDGTGQLADAIIKGAKSAGGSEAARAGIAVTAPDLAPAISKLTSASADCIALSVIPTQIIQAATAVQQSGKTVKLGGGAAIFFPQIIKAMGPLSEGLILVDTVVGGDEATPINTKIKAAMAEFDAKAPLTAEAMFGWISGKLIIEALKNVQGDVTPAALLKALNGLQNVDTDGLTHPISMTELKNPAFKRFFNHYVVGSTIKSGVPTKTSDFSDVGPVIDAP